MRVGTGRLKDPAEEPKTPEELRFSNQMSREGHVEKARGRTGNAEKVREHTKKRAAQNSAPDMAEAIRRQETGARVTIYTWHERSLTQAERRNTAKRGWEHAT